MCKAGLFASKGNQKKFRTISELGYNSFTITSRQLALCFSFRACKHVYVNSLCFQLRETNRNQTLKHQDTLGKSGFYVSHCGGTFGILELNKE